MTEEEINALQAELEEAKQRASDAELAAQTASELAEKSKGDLDSVVGELTEERRKKNEALAKANINNGEPDVNTLIEQALTQKEQERRKADLESAIAEFKSSKPEFQSDTAGLVFGKFKESLSRFNFTDVATKEQAKQRLEEAYRFVNFKPEVQNETGYDGTPRTTYAPPSNDGKTTQETERMLEMAKMDKEKFDKLKGKYGDAMGALGIE